MLMLKLDQLKTFLSVARLRSYTRAGEEVGLTQPAVSQQIRQLEESLGVKLLDLMGKRVSLTEAGRLLETEGQALLAHASRAAEAVTQCGTEHRGRLRIGASTTPGIYLLPGMLGLYRRRYPEVEATLAIDNSYTIARGIARNELDLGFVGAQPEEDSLVTVPLTEDQLIPLASPSYFPAARRNLHPTDLATHPFISREPGSGTRRSIDAWASAQGIELKVHMELNNPEAVKMAVAEGLGITILPLCSVKLELGYRRLVRLMVRGCHIVRPVSIIYHKEKHLAPAAQALLDLARHAVSGRHGR